MFCPHLNKERSAVLWFWALNKDNFILDESSPLQCLYIVIFYLCKGTRSDASFNQSVYKNRNNNSRFSLTCNIPAFFLLTLSIPSHTMPSQITALSSPFNTYSIPLFLFFLPSSSLLIVLPPCSSSLASNTAADLLNLNSAAYLSVQVLQRCMIPVTWQSLWALWVTTEDWRPCKSWLRGWVKE